MQKEIFNAQLLAFLNAAPTPFHATRLMAEKLDDSGFKRLNEKDEWKLEQGGDYYVVRNEGSLVAWRTRGDPRRTGVRLVGAHTDSPCLRVKPAPELTNGGFIRLGVEVYGGALLNPWFDRDLSLAGRLHFINRAGTIGSVLIDFCDPIARIPSLAIHLDREANQSRSINPQTDIPVVLRRSREDEDFDFRNLLLDHLRDSHPELDAERVLDYELSLYDTQAPALVGMEGEFIASARLDNLVSCFCGIEALLAGDGEACSMLVCNDHEEVGSMSSSGAQGPFLRSVLERMADGAGDYARIAARSMLISADNAHGIHPNYSDRHDANHGPLLNAGPVIKVNANQRYASNSATQALFRNLAERDGIPVQSFVTRTDMACGSTIGPITSAELGVRTLDVGVPQFAMHSVREMCGSEDPVLLARVLAAFMDLGALPDFD